jgi:hypothetical protein
VAPRVFLDGPFDAVAGLMYDSLNAQGLLNTLDPYGANGYPYPGGNYSDIPVEVPATTGNDAVVDRVIVELRDAINPATIVATRHVWLQRDGDVVDMDGISPVRFTMAPGSYYVAIRHRNHLGAMTAAPIALDSIAATVDLTLPAIATYGTDARRIVGTVATLWAGDVIPTNTVPGYFPEDVNMDGVVRYVGVLNDRDLILQTIGGFVPTNVRLQQLP